jgi:hypothetical protein
MYFKPQQKDVCLDSNGTWIRSATEIFKKEKSVNFLASLGIDRSIISRFIDCNPSPCLQHCGEQHLITTRKIKTFYSNDAYFALVCYKCGYDFGYINPEERR